MAVPTTRFRQIPNSTAVTAVNTSAKRLAAIAGEREVSTGSGNELKFGIADISMSAGYSDVATLLWDVTANGGNTTVKDFKFWLASNGFDVAGSILKMAPLSGADQVAPSLTENYKASATYYFYNSWSTMPEATPGTINVYPSDEGSSMSVAGGTSDDAVMVALCAYVASGETTGFYYGLTSGYELRFNYMYTYS
jgi:hypothetical protein